MKTPKIIEKKKYEAAVIIHHIDGDGYCGAFWAYEYALSCGIDTSKIFFRKHDYAYSVNLPNIVDNMLLIMVDISFPIGAMEDLYNKIYATKGSEFIWVDHHATAISELKELDMPGIRYSGIAASELMYWYHKGYTQEDIETKNTSKIAAHFEPPATPYLSEDVPLGTWFVADNDVWAHTTRNTRYYAQYVHENLPKNGYNDKTYGEWVDMFKAGVSIVQSNIDAGRVLYNNLVENVWKPLVKEGAKKSITVGQKTYSAYVVETGKYNSFMFESVEDTVDLFVKHVVTNDNCHKYTLYTGNSAEARHINIGALCKEIVPNGGGHFGAGGFISDTEAFI